MTEIEKKALALVNEFSDYEVLDLDEAQYSTTIQALLRAIEQHEAFRQEVSDALTDVRDNTTYDVHPKLWRYIRAKPDPRLAEVWGELFHKELNLHGFLAALAKRGLQVTEIERGQYKETAGE